MSWVYEIALRGAPDMREALANGFQSGPRQALAALPGLASIDLYTPAEGPARDPYNQDGTGPLMLLMLGYAARGIVGESGSGKSTVARMLCGLERPSQGAVVIAGRDVSDGSAAARAHQRGHVQMVFQDPQSALNPRRRVASIVTQVLEATGETNWEQRLARAEALLAEIGLPPEAAQRFPAQLSGGQRQRVNIARALCATPRVLIADEIVSGLDVSGQAQLLDLLMRLRRQRGFSMLFISHDLSVVRYLCDRVLVMYRGEVVESDPTAKVFAAPSHPYTRTLLAAVPPDDPSAPWTPQTIESEAADMSIQGV
jgi:peptide/nickel transport system ATP-binding protein